MSSRPIVISRGRSARQHVEHRPAALRIAVGGDHAGRLVEQEQPRALDRRDRRAVELDPVGRHDIEGRRGQLPAVDPDPAGGDQVLGVAPRGDARARQPLGDALATLLGGDRRASHRVFCRRTISGAPSRFSNGFGGRGPVGRACRTARTIALLAARSSRSGTCHRALALAGGRFGATAGEGPVISHRADGCSARSVSPHGPRAAQHGLRGPDAGRLRHAA